mgnify:CR=1 FL=1
MKIFKIKDMVKGWFIGDFDPCVIKSKDVEVAHHFYKSNYENSEGAHYHKKATEINYIVNGEVIASGKKLTTGDIFVYEPYDVSDVQFLSDTNLIVVKMPSCTNDKFLVNE